ncbi:MAG: DegT/DnrJ/EryC1/StrS family aminotransferase [Planctomycetota bacterium]
MQVSSLDLKSQYSKIQNELNSALNDVVKSQHFILGPIVEKLEEELSKYLGVKHSITVASGSDALLISLMALNVGAGDEVITTPFTFFATAGAIARLGAKPVFVDIEPDTYNINPIKIRSALASYKHVKAIIPVHLYGQCTDMSEIISIGREYKIPVIEDAAQAIGAVYSLPTGSTSQNCKAGTMTELGCFSFYPTKNLGGWGDGGFVTTNDSSMAKLIKCLRVHGGKNRYYHQYIGLNSRLDAMQAAILRVKLKYIEQWNQERSERAGFYDRLLKESKLLDYISLPITKSGRNHIYHQYTIRILSKKVPSLRDELCAFLKKNEIGCEIYYPLPLHLQQCFNYLGYKKGDFPESEKSSLSVLSLPIYPELTEKMQVYVTEKIKEFFISR